MKFCKSNNVRTFLSIEFCKSNNIINFLGIVLNSPINKKFTLEGGC